MNFLKSFAAVVLITFIFNSCCRTNACKCYNEWGVRTEDCSVKHFGPYPLGGAYDYLYFEPGSWWVYKNSLSGETDSIFITSCDTQVVSHTGQTLRWQSVSYTAIRFSTRSATYNTDYEYFSFATVPDQLDFKYTQNKMRSSSRNPGQSGPWEVFKYPFPAKNETGYFEYFPILNIQGKDYFEVGVYELDFDHTVQLPKKYINQVGYGGNSKYFWAKGFGIIKIESFVYDYTTKFTHLQKWELVKSNLIQ